MVGNCLADMQKKNLLYLLKKILKYIPERKKKQYVVLLLLMLCCSCLETVTVGVIAVFASSVSDYNGVINSKYVEYFHKNISGDFPASQQELIIFLSILIVLFLVLKHAFQIWQNFLTVRFSGDMEGLFGKKLLKGILRMPYEWHVSKNSADLVFTVALRQYLGTGLLGVLLMIISDTLLISFLLISLLIVQPLVSIIVIICLGGTAVCIYRIIRKRLDRIASQSLDLRQYLNQLATKCIHGIKDVKVLGRENFFSNHFYKGTLEFAQLNGFQATLSLAPSAILEIVGFIMLTTSICFMIILFNSSAASVSGTITLLAVTAWRILPAINRLLQKFTSLRNSIPYIEQVFQYYDEIDLNEEKIQSKNIIKKAFPNFRMSKQIEVKQLFFSYKNGIRILSNINLSINRGDAVGLIGVSGAGKSTLVDLVTGLLTPTSGEILIDGINIDRNSEAWMHSIGYVSQSPYIADASLAENIAFGIDPGKIDRKFVKHCCKLAAMDFIDDLKDGIDTMIGERGVRLSGGQRQRVSIARALYNQPSVMIFDEATSSLDMNSESSILKTIYGLKGKQTMIIVAHRLATVEKCDALVWIDKGRVKMIDTPNVVLDVYNSKFK